MRGQPRGAGSAIVQCVAASFGWLDVLRMAAASLRAGWAAHALAGLAFVALLVASCCGVTCIVAVPLAVLLGITDPRGTAASDDPPWAVLAVIYVAIATTEIAVLALHEGVTLELTHAHARGERPALGAAARATLHKAPALIGSMVLRLVVDTGPPLLAISLGAAVLVGAGIDGSAEPGRTVFALATTLAYLATLAWLIASRAYTGLAISCVVRDGLGPVAALGKSRALLAGRRWHFAVFRVAFAVVAVVVECLSLVPFVVVAGVAGDVLDGHTDATTLLGLGIILAFYGMILVLYTLDSVLLGAYHACLAPKIDAETLAKVFE